MGTFGLPCPPLPHLPLGGAEGWRGLGAHSWDPRASQGALTPGGDGRSWRKKRRQAEALSFQRQGNRDW